MSNLNKARMRELIQSYGADTRRWPEAERQSGQAWLTSHPKVVQKLLADAQNLDQMLDMMHQPASDTSMLKARILKVAEHTEQNSIAANDSSAPSRLASWKSVAATLVLTTGIGFGIGQVAAADTSYASAEALLSISMQSDYDEIDLYGDGQ